VLLQRFDSDGTRTANPKATSIPNTDFLPEIRQDFCIYAVDGASIAERSIFEGELDIKLRFRNFQFLELTAITARAIETPCERLPSHCSR
jgi:hypothetical protein